MDASLLSGVALGLVLSVLVVRPKSSQQSLLLGVGAILVVLAAALEGRWTLVWWQLAGAVLTLLIVIIFNRKKETGGRNEES